MLIDNYPYYIIFREFFRGSLNESDRWNVDRSLKIFRIKYFCAYRLTDIENIFMKIFVSRRMIVFYFKTQQLFFANIFVNFILIQLNSVNTGEEILIYHGSYKFSKLDLSSGIC